MREARSRFEENESAHKSVGCQLIMLCFYTHNMLNRKKVQDDLII